MERVKFKLSRGWNQYRAGHVIPMLDIRVATILANQGRGEIVAESPPEPVEVEKPKRRRRKNTTTEEE